MPDAAPDALTAQPSAPALGGAMGDGLAAPADRGAPSAGPGTADGAAADTMLDGSWTPGAYPASPPNVGAAPPGDVRPPAETATSNLDELGLPRRVRQASLAPQLRDDEPNQPAGDGLAGDRSPEQMRTLMSSIQRGWQRGRSDTDPPSAGSGMDTVSDGSLGAGDPDHRHRPYGGGDHRR
jgi:hypothetical protein